MSIEGYLASVQAASDDIYEEANVEPDLVALDDLLLVAAAWRIWTKIDAQHWIVQNILTLGEAHGFSGIRTGPTTYSRGSDEVIDLDNFRMEMREWLTRNDLQFVLRASSRSCKRSLCSVRMAIDTNRVAQSLRAFIRTHSAQFQRLSARQSQLLEIGALAITAKHYGLVGYEVSAQNLQRGHFRVKLSTRGHPWNHSWFLANRGRAAFEIHGNLPVEDALATPGARYVVDVAVIKSGSLPIAADARQQWLALSNSDMATFVEAKALVVYPMLIAQFIGIVHELKPAMLRGECFRGFRHQGHFLPALVSLGYLHGTCGEIVKGFKNRKCLVNIVPNFDLEIAKLSMGGTTSPLKTLAQAAQVGVPL